MAYFWADDFINFLEKENIATFKLSNFWELLTNEQFLNLVESYENKGKFNVTTTEGLKQLYNILYKQKIKIRDIAFSCSNKDILECLRLYIRFFDKNKSKLKFQSLTVNSVPQKVDHLSINPKQDVENNIKNTSKFASALERLKSIAKEKQVLKHESENIPENIDNQINSQFDAPKLEVKEENKKEPKEEDIKEKKPKVKILTFDENFYNYLLKKYNSEDEALNLLLGFKLCRIFNKRYNAMNPYKKINYKEDVEFQEFNEYNFGIPKKSLFDYLAFKKILSENKEKENTDNNEQKKIENKPAEIAEEKVEETEPLETENKSAEIAEERSEKIELVETENKSVEIVEEKVEPTEPLETENKSVEIAEEKVEPTEPVETENRSVEFAEERSEKTESVETEAVKSGEIEYKTIEKKAEIMEVRENVIGKFSLKDVDETFLKNCESLLPTKLYFYGEIIEVKTWKELYISVAKLFAKNFHELLYSECSSGKGLLHSSILDIALVGGNLREPVQICDNLFLTTFERFNSKVKIYLQKIIKMAEICKADLTQIIIVT